MDHPDGAQDLAPQVDSLVRGVGPVLNSRGASHVAPEAQSAQGPLVLNDAVRRRWLYANRSGSGRCRPNVGLSCRAWPATSGPACAEPRAPAGSSVVGEEVAGVWPESCCRDCRVGTPLTVRVEVPNL